MTDREQVLRDRLNDAIAFLKLVLEREHEPIQRAAAIKSFEFCVELGWRLLKANLADDGIESISPKDAIRKAGSAGLIESVERWLGYIELRDLNSHFYAETTAEELYSAIDAQLLSDLNALVAR